jgi:hypothetical protein
LRDAEKKSGAWQNGVISEKQNLKAIKKTQKRFSGG